MSVNFSPTALLSPTLLMSIGAALAFTTGGIFMQLSNGLTKPFPSVMVYLLFALGATLQTWLTRQSGMGLSYVLVLGLEVLLASLFSVVFFKEGYSVLKIFGVFLVTVGVAVLRSEGG
jgi:multidrug transporter EmrE-like cation transporter